MKLTNMMRDAFVRQVMDDVPKVVYDEQIRKAVLASALSHAPAEVRRLHKEKPRWLNEGYIYDCNNASHLVPCSRDYEDRKALEVLVRADAEIVRLCGLAKQQTEQRKTLTTRVRSVTYSVTTVRLLREALPEFAKYLPEDDPKAVRTLPVVAGVVDDFVKAGWPKKEKK